MKATLPVPTESEIHAEYDRKIRSAEEWRTIQLSKARIDRAAATERADHERATCRKSGMEAGLAERVWLDMVQSAEAAFRVELERITVRFCNLVTDAWNGRVDALASIGVDSE
jgi:hypothetical protein